MNWLNILLGKTATFSIAVLQQIDLKLNKTTIYSSYRKVERALNMGSGTITRRMKGNITKPYKKRYLITKIN